MSTITSLGANDTGATSRGVINTNFTNLNTDKVETSVLDTDGTLAANSDAKVATQKAVKTYTDTSVSAFVSAPTALTVVPFPVASFQSAAFSNLQVVGSTTGNVGLLYVPASITVNKITFKTNALSVAGTIDLSLYSEDGQTRLFSVTSGTLAATTQYSVAVSSVALAPGNYWLLVNANSTTDVQVYSYTQADHFVAVTSEPSISGTYTITADTPPETLTLSSISSAISKAVVVRLDN